MILQKFLRSKYCITIGPIIVKESDHVDLDFKKHIENLCWNANYKLHALRGMTKNLTVQNAKLLIASPILLL